MPQPLIFPEKRPENPGILLLGRSISLPQIQDARKNFPTMADIGDFFLLGRIAPDCGWEGN
jgi:hypothetical protein